MSTDKADYNHIIRVVWGSITNFFQMLDNINSCKTYFYGFKYLKVIEADTNTKSITFTCGTDDKPWDRINTWDFSRNHESFFGIHHDCYKYITEIHAVYNSSKYSNCGELYAQNNEYPSSSWRYTYHNKKSTEEIVNGIYSVSNVDSCSSLPITLGDKVVAAFFTENEEAVTENNDTDTTCD